MMMIKFVSTSRLIFSSLSFSFPRSFSDNVVDKGSLITSLTVQLPERSPVHVLKGGNGPHSILCIPGALGTALSDYSPQLEYFSTKQDFNITAFDPIGYGKLQTLKRTFQTEPIHFLKQDGLDGYLLMKQLSLTVKEKNTFSVFGWSDGGIAAMFLAACFPDVVRKLVIWGANAYVSSQDIEMFEKTRDISNWSPRMRESLEAIYGDNLSRMWSEWMDSMVYVLNERGGDICKSVLPDIKAPTLILHGDKDPLVPEFHLLYLNDNISNSRVYRFPEGKHNIHLKYADEFNKIVEEFLVFDNN